MPVIYNSADYDRIAGEIVERAKQAASTLPRLRRSAIIPVSYADPYKLEPHGVAQVEERVRSLLDTDNRLISWSRVNFTTSQFFFKMN